MNSEKIINAWREASYDLNLKIQAPFILTPDNGSKLKFDLLIEEFGGPQGTIILSSEDMTIFNTPEKYGYYCSALNPDSYSVYDRQHFIDTLNDWGYYGDKSNTPEWYTGQLWTN